MGIIRILFYLAILVGGAMMTFYFLPSNAKEKTLTYIDESSFVPEGVKDFVENNFAPPSYTRKKLLAELEANLDEIQTVVVDAGASEEAHKTITRTKQIIKEILETNTEPTAAGKLIETITETITQTFVKGDAQCVPVE